jgi:hypothetical protein
MEATGSNGSCLNGSDGVCDNKYCDSSADVGGGGGAAA